MKFLAICGSLRKESYNLKLLKAFGDMLPSEVSFDIKSLQGIPLFNEDQESIAIPSSVDQLANDVASADALVIGTPEYNYSIPGVLKNAIDWVSRHSAKPFVGKTAVLMGASPGRLGTARAQYHLRQVAVFLDLRFLNRPEVMVSEAHTKFDAAGRLTDVKTKEILEKAIANLFEAVRTQPT